MSIFRNKKRTDFYKGLKDVDFNIEGAFDFEKILEHTKEQSRTILDTIKKWERNKKHTEKDEYDQYLKSESQKYLKDIKNSCEELLKCNESTIKNILQIFKRRLENASKAKFGLFTFGAVLDNKKNKKRLEEIAKSVDPLIKKIKSENLVERNAILGGDLNTKDKYGYTPLMQAIRKYNPVIAKLLINKGANLDIQDKNGYTALIWAIREEHTDVAKLLIDKGANLDIQDKNGYTALIWAIREEHTDVAKLLIDKGANLDIQDENESSLVSLRRFYKKHANIILSFIDKGRTALMWAIMYNNKDIVKILIDKGAKLDIQNEYGYTALMLAIMHNNKDIAKILIDKGAKLDIQNEYGYTALIWAILGKHEAIAKLLINKGANLDIQDKNGYTALIWAIREEDTDVAKLLIDKGAKLDIQNEYGYTALMLAIMHNNKDIAKILIDKGAKLDIQDKKGCTALSMAEELKLENVIKAIKEKTDSQNKSNNKTNDPGIFKGLPNNQNYCYLNTALQNLYHNSSFRRKVLNYNTNTDEMKDITKQIKSEDGDLIKSVIKLMPAEIDQDYKSGERMGGDNIETEQKRNAYRAMLCATKFFFEYLSDKIDDNEFNQNREKMAYFLGYDKNKRNSNIIQQKIEKACTYVMNTKKRLKKETHKDNYTVPTNEAILKQLYNEQACKELLNLQDDDFYLKDHEKLKTIKTIFQKIRDRETIQDNLFNSIGTMQSLPGLRRTILQGIKAIAYSKNSKLLTRDSNISLNANDIKKDLVSCIESVITRVRSNNPNSPRYILPLKDNKFMVTFADRTSGPRSGFTAEEEIDLAKLVKDNKLVIFSNEKELDKNKTKFKLVSATIGTGDHYYLYVKKDSIWHHLNDSSHEKVLWENIKENINKECETLTYKLI